MNAAAVPVLDIFVPKQRIEVPLFQRPYVWNMEDQWAPLWEDIARKFGDFLYGRTDSPVHFLGAMVLDQKMSPTTHVVRRQVIDGQQRLTTLQIFLAALRDFCSDQGCLELAAECRSYTFNSGMMANADVDQFKVWPTALDRDQYSDVLTSGSRVSLVRKHPAIRRKYSRHDEPRPRMVEAYLYFYDQIAEFFLGDDGMPPIIGEVSLADRLNECLTALKSTLQVVVIDLGEKDDPQVIFETLNARGEPLRPADLLRNDIFLRAGRDGGDQEQLYDEYWVGFEDAFWNEEIRQGRLSRPRIDLFMQHFLASRLSLEISPKHQFVEYKHWIESEKPFNGVPDELKALAQQREAFRRIVAPKETDALAPFSKFVESFDVSTVYPVILTLLETGCDEEELRQITTHLESYMMRRSICGLTNKNYNRVFLSLNKMLRTGEGTGNEVAMHLIGLSGSSTYWPSDDQFLHGWLTCPIYQSISSARLGYVLRRLNSTYLTNKTEELRVLSDLSIEHILPQSWVENWPLPDGSHGLEGASLLAEDEGSILLQGTLRRNAALQTIGNLTLLTQTLNSSASNAAWPQKRIAIQQNSLLPMNLALQKEDRWDEDAIDRRGRSLFEKALEIWPKPNFS